MIEGMYTAAAGMAAQQTRLDAVANDLANTSTTGYKHNRVAFRDLLYQNRAHGALPPVMLGAGAAATPIGRDMAQGAAQRTDRPLDVTLQGPGFLQVRLPDGRTGLTRDGNLRVDPQGRIGLQTGELVQPAITMPAGVSEEDVAIGADGTIRAGERVLGRLQIVEVRSPGQLDPVGNNSFVVSNGSGPTRAATRTTALGGTLEASNTDAATAMTWMIESQRAFQLASKAIQTQDRLWEVANQVKR